MLTEHTKQRWIHVCVLIALIAIFLPTFWPGPDFIQEFAALSAMPIAPKKPSLLTAIKADTGKISEQHPVSLSRQYHLSQPEFPKSAMDYLQSVKVAASTWVIQVDRFTDADIAAKLVESLRAQGFAAYQRRQVTNETDHVIVYVGPVITQEGAETLNARLEKIMNKRGTVEVFDAVL